MAKTWIFQGNPNRFKLDDFFAARPTETNWLVRQYSNEIAPGDTVFIWRAIGTGSAEDSGIVAEGEVLTTTSLMPELPQEQSFWTDPAEANAVAPRVTLRIVRIADKGSMLLRRQLIDDPVLRDLLVLRRPTGTNFPVTSPQAVRLETLWARSGGQNFRNPAWVRDELIVALDMYLRHAGNAPGKESSEIIELSHTLNRLARYLGLTRADRFRNANGVYMKLMNFRRFDPVFTGTGRVGLSRGGKLEEEVWAEFAHDAARCHQVAETIRQAIEVAPEGETVPDPTGEEMEEAEEGRVITALHRRYERNSAIVKTKKARALATLGRLTCDACGLDFAARYGEHGAGFIECHHTKPIHALRPGEKTKVSDLRLLCSNCHRMVHSRRPWLTIEGLIAILNGAPAG